MKLDRPAWWYRAIARPHRVEKACVYVMARSDGWHKIGCSDWPEKRREALALKVAPVKLVKKFCVGDMYGVEWLAHYKMRSFPRRGEWFQASEEECCRAVTSAVRLYRKIGRSGLRDMRAEETKKKKRVTHGGKRLPRRNVKPGRKSKYWPSDDVEKAARKLWFSVKNIPTDAAAVRQIVDQWSDLVNEKGKPLVTERLVRSLGPSGRQKT